MTPKDLSSNVTSCPQCGARNELNTTAKIHDYAVACSRCGSPLTAEGRAS